MRNLILIFMTALFVSCSSTGVQVTFDDDKSNAIRAHYENYLNQDMEGGWTTFPVVDRSFMPLAGCALTWDNLKEDGKLQPAAKHQAERVAFGEKYIVTA
jgi:uncharacterized protein YceK